MKKRDLYWIRWILLFLGVILLFGGIFFYSLIQFNVSYIKEEKDELNVFQKQIIWAITPYLKANAKNKLEDYTDDFYGEDVQFRIFDKDEKLLTTSNIKNKAPMVREDSKLLRKKKPWKIYRHSIKDKKIVSIDEFYIDGTKYYIELTLLEDKVIGKIIKAQINLTIILAICLIILISGILQLMYQIRASFNKFDDSVLKIANGDLDAELEVPRLKILEELALCVKKMATRLKNQIARLEMLEKYKDEFIQNASHEIKTPITAINMALELLENSNNEKQNKEFIDIIHFQIHTINKLINDMLKLSEIDVEKTNEQKNFKLVNLNQLITKVINSFGSKDTKINFINSKNIDIQANEDLLISAVENLLTNAIRYSGSDKIDVILEKKENQAKIHIKDYGIGIKKDYQEKIFEKFYRIDKARSRKRGGSGLGLAIVKNIVELHNGSIEVESEENKGADFIIGLPLKC